MEAKITIDYSVADTAARRYIEYLGAKGVVKDYQRILLQTEDADLLSEWHDGMMSSLMGVLMTWSTSEEATDSGKEVTLYMPDNVRSSVPDTVQREAEAFCACYIESRWLTIVQNEQAADKAAEAEGHRQAIRDAMTRRQAPSRRTPANTPMVTGYAEGNDTEITITSEES